jgi:F0F1-type ATP synthase membrane subunit a
MQSHFWEASLYGMPVHVNTLIMVAVALVILLGLTRLLTASISIRPSRLQIFAEML